MAFNPDKCMRIIAEENLTLRIYRNELTSYTPIYYSLDNGATWTEFKPSPSRSLVKDQVIFLKGTGRTATAADKWTSFGASGKFHVEGQVTSLLNDGEGGDVPLTDDYCFSGLFYNSQRLTSVPPDFLPSTTLSRGCYQKMFMNAVNLATPEAIILPAKTLVQDCYYYMFYYTAADKIQVNFSDWINGSATQSWINSSKSSGTFACPEDLQVLRGLNYIPNNWDVDHPVNPFDPEKCMKIVAEQDLTITVNRFGLPSGMPDILFSKTGEAYTWVVDTIDLLAGESAYVKSTGATAKYSSQYTTITGTGRFHVEGQITSLLNNGLGGDVPLTEDFCFCGLFYNSPNLSRVSKDFLPSTVLSYGCYWDLFGRASGLTTTEPIVLPATELAGDCYKRMFILAEKVDKIKVNFTDWGTDGTQYTTNWVQGVAELGTFYVSADLPIKTGISNIPEKWAINTKIDPDKCLHFTALEDTCVISLPASKVDGSHYYFSKDDGETWVPDTITIEKGKKAYCRGRNVPSQGYDATKCSAFSISSPVEIGGCLSSLVDNGLGKEMACPNYQYAFSTLFNSQPVEKIEEGSCLFNFTSYDILPYYNIFSDSSLKNIPRGLVTPNLTAYPRGFLYSAFARTKITKVPADLSVADLPVGKDAFRNFCNGCTELVEIEDGFFKNVDIAGAACFYAAFGACPKLKTIPKELPYTGTSDNCFRQMFMNCTSLKKAPVINIQNPTPTTCCQEMFSGCSSLEEITVKFVQWPEDTGEITNWVAGVAEKGSFYCPEDFVEYLEYDDSHVPVGWQVSSKKLKKVAAHNKITLQGRLAANFNYWKEVKVDVLSEDM